MSVLDDHELLYRVAHYFYVNDFSQVEISRMEGLSRPQVSRLIARARELGMVKIQVEPFRDPDLIPLEQALEAKLGLGAVHVFPADEPEEPDSRFISAVGAWLSRELPRYSNIGLAWSRTLYRASFRLLPQKAALGMRFTPLQGNAGINVPWLQANSVLDRYAANFGAEAVFTQCSLFTPSAALETPLEGERFRLLREGWQGLEAAVMGIGAAPEAGQSYIREVAGPVYRELMNMQAVGDLFGSFFNERGEVFPIPEGYTLASFPIGQIKAVPQVICLASGAAKAQAISVAARCGYIKTLAIDETAAQALLAL